MHCSLIVSLFVHAHIVSPLHRLFYALGNPLFKYYDYIAEDSVPVANITVNENTTITTENVGTQLDISQGSGAAIVNWNGFSIGAERRSP